ncbi:MAG TPA: mechanosensitive ion channel family protein [Myxococcota bacterium]
MPTTTPPWLTQHMPPALQEMGPLDLAWWQWLGLPVVVVIGGLFGLVASRLILGVIGQITRRTEIGWDNELVTKIRGPVRLWWTAALTKPVSLVLGLHADARTVLNQCLIAAATVALFWGVLRGIDVVAQALTTTQWAARSSSSKTLIPLGRRFSKLFLGALAVASALSVFGVPVASIVAGLGVGGLAVALAAQKTFENLLGAFAIGVDQPFREGDPIKVDDVNGSVESVGLRSTRIRTAERTIVTIPNGQLAEKRIETFAARDRLRLYSVIGLDYETRPKQVRAVLAGIEQMLRTEEKVWPNDVAARMIAFGQASLDVEVQCWLMTTDWVEYSALRTKIFLQIMDVLEENGVAFAPERRMQLFTAPDPQTGSATREHKPATPKP